MKRIGLIILLSTLGAAPLAPAAAQDLLWTRQIGSAANESPDGAAVDGTGSVYITGSTQGPLSGSVAMGLEYFLARYDAAGTLLWLRQAGTITIDRSTSVAVDNANNAYITGWTAGNLGGQNAGKLDYFVAKYDTTGTLLWMHQAGTSESDWPWSVAVDRAGNAYITGYSEGDLAGPNAGRDDVFLAKYDASGTLLWTRQFGTSEDDEGTGVAVDSEGNVIISGTTRGSLGGPHVGIGDYFLAKFDASGTLLWTRQSGTRAHEVCNGVAVDGLGNAYITGYTDGNLGGPSTGYYDVFLAKYDTSGALLWTRQYGSPRDEAGAGVAVDSAGNVHVAGSTSGSLSGQNAGGDDYFLAKYDASGTPIWTRQAGTIQDDWGNAVAVDGEGNAYITGQTWGDLGGPNAGIYDVFLAKYGEAPCYADCDKSTGNGVLDIFDFLCWQNDFVTGNSYACDCDTSTGRLVCDIFDFLCFQNAFVAGCP